MLLLQEMAFMVPWPAIKSFRPCKKEGMVLHFTSSYTDMRPHDPGCQKRREYGRRELYWLRLAP